MTTRAVLCVCVLGLVACGGESGGDGGDTDAGGARDAGGEVGMDVASDAGASSSDGGIVPDAASSDGGDSEVDGGPELDGGSELDAGTERDGGSQLDGGRTGPVPGPGDLVIVEIQGNPQIADDEEAEYIELLNVSGRELDLQGVTIAHLNVPPSAMDPDASESFSTWRITPSVSVPVGGRVLLARSSGGFFGGATRDHVYGNIELHNGNFYNRIRLLVPGWDGSEPPAPEDLIDQVIIPPLAFDNPLRGRALQLDPDRVPSPTAASNDTMANFCYAAATDALAYRASNWGTPRAENRCD